MVNVKNRGEIDGAGLYTISIPLNILQTLVIGKKEEGGRQPWQGKLACETKS